MAEEELERFRRQWRQEVTARTNGSIAAPSIPSQPTSSEQQASAAHLITSPGIHPQSTSKPSSIHPYKSVTEDVHVAGYDFDDLDEREKEREKSRRLGESGTGVHPESIRSKEPGTALEHYEKAVERETQGQMGESLKHYRAAFKVPFHYNILLLASADTPNS